jgi:diaminobutyrate-2-oxoglutarate transaminase
MEVDIASAQPSLVLQEWGEHLCQSDCRECPEMLDYIARIESAVRGYVRSFPTVFTTASGAWLTDSEGRRYLDFFAGAGAINYGHNNPRVKAALLDFIGRDGLQHSLDMATEAKIDFLIDFESIILRPRNLDYRVQFTGPTGTNAVEAAIKLARKAKKRSHVVAFTNAYHGHSLGSLALTGNRYYHSEHYGSHSNVTHLPYDGYLGDYDTTELLDKLLRDNSSGLPLPAAVILETIQCEGGINVASGAWLRSVAALCKKHDIVLIVDDIQVGNGRTGTFFSFENAGIKPDIVCLSKSIGGGLPMSLVLLREELDQWKPGEHTGTFRGNNLAFVAGRSLLQYWATRELSQAIAQHETTIESRLQLIANRHCENNFTVRGRGMVWGLDVKNGQLATAISRQAFQQRLIIETAGAEDQVIKLIPPLTISSDELEKGLKLLEIAIESVLRPGTIANVLVADPQSSLMSRDPMNQSTTIQDTGHKV